MTVKLVNGLNMRLKGKKIMLIFLASSFVVNVSDSRVVLEYIG